MTTALDAVEEVGEGEGSSNTVVLSCVKCGDICIMMVIIVIIIIIMIAIITSFNYQYQQHHQQQLPVSAS
jgi:hypothetical protein